MEFTNWLLSLSDLSTASSIWWKANNNFYKSKYFVFDEPLCYTKLATIDWLCLNRYSFRLWKFIIDIFFIYVNLHYSFEVGNVSKVNDTTMAVEFEICIFFIWIVINPAFKVLILLNYFQPYIKLFIDIRFEKNFMVYAKQMTWNAFEYFIGCH